MDFWFLVKLFFDECVQMSVSEKCIGGRKFSLMQCKKVHWREGVGKDEI